jgi:hypothetical protein
LSNPLERNGWEQFIFEVSADITGLHRPWCDGIYGDF